MNDNELQPKNMTRMIQTKEWDKHEFSHYAVGEASQNLGMETVYNALTASFQERLLVHVRLFDDYEDRRVIGMVEEMDTRFKRFKVDGEWFEISEVFGAEIEGYD
ncbi:hypothetical protein M3231_01915 [Neobacillus mesonae]|nr:hypothetical protein [Neobacillus mesonae]